ncbi:MAG: Asp-tRNA(Asn)/Glu-tRNA(Gln) amidotransferase subunit GatA [Thermoanaerobacteraceae bacterium]|uniref:Asp-tRNA(Asn)/Glu-tRNA(Gln) amidotransferase subunit GatA n=1 Tax=Thermanaeromonas sp. C210 TaxID=2731925 RepID=UPI000E84A505|nr:Asp-tRNA(Asn)/Glu-tRNA(Gln) amidotransferase subunit GatA [Thermanaeromonas sp. C210]MBE3581943.1 Asp-tRNA(Asn)/Glu-tRNA(Gln) amidotransferase subunit GatA [Thermoanaerobacteraceae bacterium]GFN22254.1 glutamyl-tRNA(Gln) amidotransferase subunit A [Thermanaeromonas sp. C210]HBT46627.1 Asp-tRNA(Asn)/Glu-tRNA(Gln) amidotransferase GatCAB subunit A [Peptococcaceae bacterium]
MELFYQSAYEVSRLLARKEIGAEELTRAVLDRIEGVEGQVKAFVTLTPEAALEQARAIDAARVRGDDLGPLAGIPMALKDNLCTEGVRTTCSSKMLENWVPPYDAFVVKKLKEAGAVLLGKLNMDEFAMGSSTENSRFFPTRNPWDLERVPGGSSGGPAAAVAAGEAFYSLGSDTGGSIRQPASFCGVVGMKPTYGRVSRSGLVAFASSLDQIGPFAREVTDCALVLQAIAGHDPADSTSGDLPVPDYLGALQADIKGIKVGVPKEYFVEGIEPEVANLVRWAIDRLADLGAICEEISLPHTEYALPAYYLVATAEASSNLARYDGVAYGFRLPGKDLVDMYVKTRSEGFGPEVKRRIMLGTYALSSGYYDAYYLKALKVRTLIRRDFEEAFQRYDILATPTSPTVAFRLGERITDPLAMYLSDLFTCPVNMAGLPAISIPCGFSQGLPVGLQLIAKPFAEETLLRVAYTFEQATASSRRWPQLGVVA